MAVTITFLNSRESSVPYQDTDADGNPTFSRKYQAFMQVLVEGSVAECMSYNTSLPSVGEPGGGAIPPTWSDITIDGAESFVPANDFHPNEIIKDKLVYATTQVLWNYDKVSSWGKMTGQIQIEINGPVETINTGTGAWTIKEPIEY